MKNLILVIALLAVSMPQFTYAQEEYVDTTNVDDRIYYVKTYNGGEFIGTLKVNNSKEVVIITKDRGEVSIPKYQIEEIRTLESSDISEKGSYIPDQVFASRYFITTNGLPIRKGESYALYNLWGPDFQFGVADNLSVGIITSWVAFPIIGSIKYSIPLDEKNSIGLGLLAGHTVWYAGALNAGGVLPFGTITRGNRKSNISFSAGYGQVWAEGNSGGSALFSVGGMAYLNRNITFVFDSFVLTSLADGWAALVIPGLRFQRREKSAFQFGFTGVLSSEGTLPVAIPFVSWFRKF